MKNLFYSLIFALLIQACNNSNPSSNLVFEAVPAVQSGVHFSNSLIPNDSMNYFLFGYYYMGAGVSVGDVNNDGLEDIYFTANNATNKLYLNEGDLKFKDITELSGVAGGNQWMNGVAMSDVNADGLMDIYVSVAGIWGNTENILYINQGLDENGIPTFKDEAKERGVADYGLTIQSCFLDYDQDGDIDLFVGNYENTSFDAWVPGSRKNEVNEMAYKTSDHLYQNDGTGHFVDITKEAGVLNYGLAAGVIAADLNNDNLTDIYVSNDFNVPDYYYVNNGDGTFTDKLKEATQHTVFYGMGIDVADINNDGLMDLTQMDMVPIDNFRSKANMASMDIPGFWRNVAAGFHYQYMYNALQLNQGIKEDGLPFYADIAKMSGVHQTDWSWAPLFSDFNNDGFQDLFITNGSRKDVNNKDFFKRIGRMDIKMKIKYKELTFVDLTEQLSSESTDNFMFKNVDGQNFERVNEDWGIVFKGFSNGAAYADLDNDGDLELVVNNIDSAASIFKNLSVESGKGKFLSVVLEGPQLNPIGIGTKVKVKSAGQTHWREQVLVRGYESSVGTVLHFGVGSDDIEEVEVNWPDGKVSLIENVKANQRMVISHADAKAADMKEELNENKYFEVATDTSLSSYRVLENEFDDFQHQILIPHMMSRLGPAVATADVNGDQLDDLYIGGAFGVVPSIFYQKEDGSFDQVAFAESEAKYEDVKASFFDADNDGDLDLYVVSGGNDLENESPEYQDRLYVNDNGLFINANVLPQDYTSGGVVLPLDYDQDGDLDLFVGGRQKPREYPMPANSFFLENKMESGTLSYEKTEQPIFEKLGMVTDAINIDLNKDGLDELVVVGEWMPIRIFDLDGKAWVDRTEDYNLNSTVGWWSSVSKADFDNDGDEDLVVGNLGLNYKYQASEEKTFDIYVNDYDENGKIDIVLGYYQGDVQYPVRGMQCSSQQIPAIKNKYQSKYDKFGKATLSDIYGETHLDASIHYQVSTFASVYIENTGTKELELKNMPFEIQTSNLNSVVIKDFNQDGNLDIVAGGNQFNSEIETPRNDACFGWMLLGDGTGGFEYVDYAQSGLYVPYDIREVVTVKGKEKEQLVFVSNRAPVVVYDVNK